MTRRHTMILQLKEKQSAVYRLSEKMKPSYNPIGGHSGLSQTTYERCINEINSLNNEIYSLKIEIVKLPKEQNAIDLELKDKLCSGLKHYTFQKAQLQQKIDNCKDWGLDNLKNSMSLIDENIDNIKILLSLL